MSKTSVPERIKIRLWGKAAGRCQYSGCNQILYRDDVTQEELNASYIAHIIADSPNGPRGHDTFSEELKADISNLMLMCDKHHRLIDREDVEGNTVAVLRKMKANHESRMELITSVKEEMQSHILIYTSNVGEHNPHVNWPRAANAMLPEYYPTEKQAIELGLKNNSMQDHSPEFWQSEKAHLVAQFDRFVKPRLMNEDIKHLSIFGFTSQPLLLALGHLLSDIVPAEVYQLHREPPDWKWQEEPGEFEYQVIEPDDVHENIAINLSLSATINNERIISVLGEDTSIWTITHTDPNNDFLKGKGQLQAFRQVMRRLMNEIKAAVGENMIINLFPAAPVSTCVELGRIVMPKADLPIRIFDQNQKRDGFVETIVINEN